jgi:transcriptional regulator with XRE-family HTH domain
VAYSREVKENTKTIIDRVGGPTIGARIRRLRVQTNMSIRELAEKADISKNSLLRVEQGFNTHAATVLKICEVLGLHIESVAEETASQPPLAAVHKVGDDRWYDMVNFGAGTLGGLARPLTEPELAKFGKSGKVVPLNRITARLQNGRVFPTIIELYGNSPVRSHPGEEFVYVLSGKAIVVVNNQSHELNEGESITFWSAENHSYESATPGVPARILSVRVDYT